MKLLNMNENFWFIGKLNGEKIGIYTQGLYEKMYIAFLFLVKII